MLAYLPSLEALESDDDVRLAAEVRLARLRSQAAIVHALADQVEHLSRAADAEGLGDQLIEEIARLGCRLLETAGSLAGATRRGDSGVFARPLAGETGSAQAGSGSPGLRAVAPPHPWASVAQSSEPTTVAR